MPTLFALFLLLSTPALAHPGDHSSFSWQALGLHVLLEPDHLLFAAVTVAVAIFAYRAGRRSGARDVGTRERESR